MSVSSSLTSSPAPSEMGSGAASPFPHHDHERNGDHNHNYVSGKDGNSLIDSVTASVREKMKLSSTPPPPPPPPALADSGYRFYSIREPPPLDITLRLVSAFVRGTSSLIYILAEHEATELINDTYSPNSQPTTVKLCELLAITAVGAQYEDVGGDVTSALFKSAKWYLDIEYGKDVDVLRKMRVSMLVGLFLIFEKSFFAVDYLDQAVRLGKSIGINRTTRCRPYSEREWASWRRVWCSLIFLDGWMASSIGIMPKISPGEDPIFAECYRTCTNDFDAYLHSELIKLGILMGTITKNVYAPTTIDFLSVAEQFEKLKAWHSSLPESLRLTRTVSGNDSRQRSTVLLTHCSYLNCVVLLGRKILVEQSSGQDSRRGLADEYAQMCVSAGRHLATVIGIICRERRLVRRCWLAIQSSYTAGLIVCLCLANRRCQDPMHFTINGQDNELLGKCIGALEYCAPHDNVAQRYLGILNLIRRSIDPPSSTFAPCGKKPPRKRLRITPDQELGKFHLAPNAATDPITQFVVNLLRNPFGGENSVLEGGECCSLHPPGKVFPENWRFLCPEPPRHIEGFKTPDECAATSFRISSPSSEPSTSASTGSDGFEDCRKRKVPFRTVEEFEAFFRRVA